jgi:hypothetical protein
MERLIWIGHGLRKKFPGHCSSQGLDIAEQDAGDASLAEASQAASEADFMISSEIQRGKPELRCCFHCLYLFLAALDCICCLFLSDRG